MITIDDFKKVDLRIGKIIAAEKVPNSDKLLKLQVDLGGEKRQLVAGIAGKYDVEFLIGKKMAIVANLAPRTLMGLESQGMLLAASGSDGPVILMPESDVPEGAPIK